MKETKEKGKSLKHQTLYTETITQPNDQTISLKHVVDVILFIFNLIRANKSGNTQFINGAKQLEAHLALSDYLFLARGFNGIPMSFGLICDI